MSQTVPGVKAENTIGTYLHMDGVGTIYFIGYNDNYEPCLPVIYYCELD